MFLRIKKLPKQQRFFLGVGVFFVIALVCLAVYRSTRRVVLISGSGSQQSLETILGSAKEATFDGSGLHLQDFHRVEMKNGVPIWEVSAKDAKYHASEQLAFVTEATVQVYRNQRSAIRFRANEGKLFLDGNALQKAELRGNIEVAVGDDMNLKADVAFYDQKEDAITATGKVTIYGPGYEISGLGLTMSLSDQKVNLLSSVESHFEPSSQATLPPIG